MNVPSVARRLSGAITLPVIGVLALATCSVCGREVIKRSMLSSHWRCRGCYGVHTKRDGVSRPHAATGGGMHLALVHPVREPELVHRDVKPDNVDLGPVIYSGRFKHLPLDRVQLGFGGEFGVRLDEALREAERHVEAFVDLVPGLRRHVDAQMRRPVITDLPSGDKSTRTRPTHSSEVFVPAPTWRAWTGFRPQRAPLSPPVANVAEAVFAARASAATAHPSTWRTIGAYAARVIQRESPGIEVEDVVQDTLVAVFERAAQARDEGPAAARAWVATVARNKAIDVGRRRRARGRRARGVDLEELALPELPTWLARAQLVGLLAGVEAAIATAEPLHANGDRRTLRAQMRATLARVLGASSAAEVREAARLPADVSDELVWKWIERGREPLLELLGAIGTRSEAVDAVGALRVMVDDRRSDAGVPRPSRRHAPPTQEEPVVNTPAPPPVEAPPSRPAKARSVKPQTFEQRLRAALVAAGLDAQLVGINRNSILVTERAEG